MPSNQDKVREYNRATADLTEALRHHDVARVYYLASCLSQMVRVNFRHPWSHYRAMVSEEFGDPCLTITG